MTNLEKIKSMDVDAMAIIKGKEHLHLKDVLQNISYRSNKGDKMFLFLSCGYAVYGNITLGEYVKRLREVD